MWEGGKVVLVTDFGNKAREPVQRIPFTYFSIFVRVGAGPRKKSISMSKNNKHAIDPVEKFITDEKARPAI